MKKFQTYFTPAAAAQEEQKGSNAGTSTPAEKAKRESKSSTHQMQAMPPNGGTGTGQLAPTPVASRPSSRAPSIRGSFLPAHDARRSDVEAINEIRHDMMVNWLYEQQLRAQYASGMDPFEGVVLKKSRGVFTCYPPQMAAIPDSLYPAVVQMNVRCAMTVNTPFVRALLDTIIRKTDLDHVPLADGLRVQVLASMSDLPRCQLHHFAAFIVDAHILVVWDDEPEKLITRAKNLEAKFLEIIWGNGNDEGEEEEEKGGPVGEEAEIDPADLEAAIANEKRPVRLESALIVAITLILWIICPAFGVRWLVYASLTDGTWIRWAVLAALPAQLFVSLFFFQSLVTSVFQMIGPISAVNSNSKYYSGRPPRRLARSQNGLPHVTIQMPVYKEGLNGVIKPTVMSLKAAISTYEMQGGTASIFVNDDGMQLLSEEEAAARRDFYEEHNIGWVARPPHNPNPAAGEKRFLRRGKFKKASNMNYALHVSNRVEDKLAAIQRDSKWNAEKENAAYQEALAEVLREDEGRTWAEGNIRIGDYILIVDSDTRVPRDCLLDAVSEMEISPEVAILQFQSGVMNVTKSFFENGVTWFTRLIYSCITFSVASGDACPFVGHNAVLRWSAIQDAAAFTDEDGYEKYWSESHVSEDFDMSLRLQVAGYTLRYASYTGDGFKEGVSLTVYDELARWEKYAYGCNELMFHPLRFWLIRGPFTPLFRKFVFSNIPLPKKLTIIAYIGTYYAIASAWMLCLGNYFITGWFYGAYDKYYLDSFAIFISIVVVFTALGNLALALLRYRLSEQSLLRAYFDNIKWIPMFAIFLGGISLHLSQAILSHFFEIDMTWGATAKELETVRFGPEIVRILKRFKWTFLFCFVCTALMICATTVFPVGWHITELYAIYPLANVVVCHFCLPVLLNPALMMFTW